MIDSLGKRYIYLEEEGYKFKIASFVNEIKQWINSALTLIPNCFLAQSEKYLEDGLEDVFNFKTGDEKLSLGIPVPGDDGHLIYVWLMLCLVILVIMRTLLNPNHCWKHLHFKTPIFLFGVFRIAKYLEKIF